MSLLNIIILSLFLTNTLAALKKVTISKCCEKDEFLTGNNICIKNLSATWNISVFLKNRVQQFREKVPANWQIRYGQKPSCQNSQLVDITARSLIPFINGSMFRVETSKLIHPDSYCLDYKFVIICPESTPEKITRVAVKECCGEDAVFSEKNHTCMVYNSENELDFGNEKTVESGFPICNGKEYALTGKFNETSIVSNGSVWLDKRNILIATGNFCVENVLKERNGSYETNPEIIVCKDQLPPEVLVESAPNQKDIRFILYPVSLAIGAIFLAATLLAGSTLPANHHLLHWRCQTNHVACLLVGNVLLCITQLSGKMEPWPCFLIACIMHFFFLAAFFWLNTMCFNIWWTFRDLRPQNTEKSQERLRLRLYEAYAWGIPFAIAVIAATLDLVPVSSESHFLLPGFGKEKCWFYGDMEMLTFFYAPIGILLFINLMLFALTARELTCGLWKRELVKSTTERAALGRVCMKLVVVMGITWLADIISWAAGGPHYLWYLTDIINCLQGVFIFVVVGLQPQVLSAVKRAWCLRKHRQNAAGTTNHHSSSSQGLPSMGDTFTNTNSVNNTTKSVPLETSC